MYADEKVDTNEVGVDTNRATAGAGAADLAADPAALAAVEPALAALATAPATGTASNRSAPSPIAVFGSLTSGLLCPPIICIVVTGSVRDATVPATVAGVTLPLVINSSCWRSAHAANSPALCTVLRTWPSAFRAACCILSTVDIRLSLIFYSNEKCRGLRDFGVRIHEFAERVTAKKKFVFVKKGGLGAGGVEGLRVDYDLFVD